MSLLARAKKDGNKYLNPKPVKIGGFSMMLKVLPQYLFNKEETDPKVPLGPFATDTSVYTVAPTSGLRLTWFGHSASLIEIDGYKVLIDPIWEPRASPFSFMGPKRFFAPTVPLEALPQLDVVLISHDHYDHLGAQTMKALAKLQPNAQWVTSLGVGKRLQGFGIAAARISELDWTDSVEAGGLKFTAWPGKHFSGRGILDRFKTLWGSYVIEGPGNHRVFYGADSGEWPGFAEVAKQYECFDLVMLEIGAFSPLWSDIHMGPDGAARTYESMGGNAHCGMLMPIHWGLFNLALHGWRQPMERMIEVAAERGLRLWSPRPGEPTEVVRGEAMWSSWWKAKRANGEVEAAKYASNEAVRAEGSSYKRRRGY
jgi:L-ascorbate metabolism protein UlaG (beta-lactamase superfamily)